MSARTLGRPLIAAVALSIVALPALADFRLERELDLPPGGRLVVESDLGGVTVTGSRDSGVHVLITSRRASIEDDVEFDVARDGDTVRIEGRKLRKVFSWFTRSGNLQYDIEVPADTDVFVDTGGGAVEVSKVNGEVEIDTSGGSVRVDRIQGDLLAHTSGGSITLTQIRGGARVSTSGGSITADGVEGSLEGKTSGGPIEARSIGGDLLVRTSGGSIRIEDAGGSVEASTSGGSIAASFAPGNTSGGSLSSSGGGIRVSVDPGVDLELDAHTAGGSVECDLPVTVQGKMSRGTLRGRIGAGGETLRIRTSGGSIRIDRL